MAEAGAASDTPWLAGRCTFVNSATRLIRRLANRPGCCSANLTNATRREPLGFEGPSPKTDEGEETEFEEERDEK